ncbi:carboxylesterase/lipase family protein [Amycolatopsis jiangsuensis]|uniref:Carboxylic ester hydrolase n=1 Tax=Amycolatopsis jiangsuensis TaxID=1181879 RepID=A0A840IR64_9PSEU|nr:carboxylesterase family protein [Amycolatopsis jiangsuensis]MBB4684323.1 para-nitrobenzyl esterase [Amycolatopsis jiangsuensis]
MVEAAFGVLDLGVLRRCRSGVLVLVLALAVSACAASDASVGRIGDVVRTESGLVRGTVTPDHRVFQGIPYAAAPVAQRRWQPPAPVEPWAGERDATKPGPRCPQPAAGDAVTSEDCLSLNVWTPAAGAQGRPVLVWLHGGAFVNGGGDRYGAERLVSRGDEVVVTLNYRLGALGFLADPSLGAQPGNYGFLDQQQALRWVRDNIEAFGGDPAAVTIAGESAGGMSVCDHLVAPGSRGLFRAAIVQSGPCGAQATLADAEEAGVKYAAAHGCPDRATAAACLRALPPAKLLDAPTYVSLAGIELPGPVTGGSVLPQAPLDGIHGGAAAPVPVLLGTTHDEFTYFLAQEAASTGLEITRHGYVEALGRIFPDAAAVAAEYPVDAFSGNASLAYAATVTDSAFACPAARMSASLPSVSTYEFADGTSPAAKAVSAPFPLGATHTSELPYLFDLDGKPVAFTPAQQRLADRMVGDWTAFVRGRATGTDVSYRADGAQPLTGFAQDHHCAFWATRP